MIASPRLHKALATVSGRSLALYYTREDEINIQYAKNTDTGCSVRLDEQETHEAISQIEERV